MKTRVCAAATLLLVWTACSSNSPEAPPSFGDSDTSQRAELGASDDTGMPGEAEGNASTTDGSESRGGPGASQEPSAEGGPASESGPMAEAPPNAENDSMQTSMDEPSASGENTTPVTNDSSEAAEVEQQPIRRVFLLLGQSNMAGYAQARDSDRAEDPRITVLGFDNCAATGRVADEWDTAAPPLHECWNGAVGPGDWFAKTLIESLPEGDTIGLVPCALSGQAIEVFMKGSGTEYEWILERARAAQQAGGEIQGMIFHQGESNCGDPNWPGKVQTLVRDLRADLALGDVPMIAGELPYAGDCARHNPLVGQLPGLIDNASVVSAEGLAVDPADTQWNLHFGHEQTVELGRRYAAAMSQALGFQ